MSIQVMNLVWKNAPCQGNTLLALLALADWSDDDGRSWPSVVTLAKKSRQSERNCHTVIRELESLKILEVKRREGTSNMFVINIELLGGVQSLHGAKTSKRGGKRLKSLHGTAEMFAPYTSIETSQDQNHTSGVMSEPESKDLVISKGNPKTKNPATESRHHAIMAEVIDSYRDHNGTTPSAASLGKQLSLWLADHRDWTEQDIIRCVRNRFRSEVNHAQEPHTWVGKLASYKAGPLDKFGNLLNGGQSSGRPKEIERITRNRAILNRHLPGRSPEDTRPDGAALPDRVDR